METKKITAKKYLKNIKISKNFEFLIYILYIIFIGIAFFYYFEKNMKTKEEPITTNNIENIKKKLIFKSFEERFYDISLNLEKNNISLSSLDFKANSIKIVVNSKDKDSLNNFLNSLKNINQSSIKYIDEEDVFRGVIDVELFK